MHGGESSTVPWTSPKGQTLNGLDAGIRVLLNMRNTIDAEIAALRRAREIIEKQGGV